MHRDGGSDRFDGELQLKKWLALALLLIPLAVFGQGVRIGDELPVNSAITTPGVISTVPFTNVNICTYPANGVPCTNKATTYTGITLATPCSTSTQLVLHGTSSCVSQTDLYGNWGAWVASGTYDITFTVSGGQSYGPFTLSAGGGSAGGVSSINSLTGAVTFAPGANITLTPSGNTVTIAATGGGFTPSINGTPLSSAGLNLETSTTNATGLTCTPTLVSTINVIPCEISGTITAAHVATLNQNTTGNAATATALAATPTLCTTGQAPTGVLANGNATGCASTGGTGTVTSFSAGNLSPLFTTSVATATSTPALTFALSNAAQNSIFAGPPTGGAGAPSFQTAPTFSAANLTSFPTFNQNTTGNAATATSASNGITAGTAGYFQKAASSTTLANTLCDEGITTVNQVTCTDTAGIAGVSFTSTQSTAGFVDYPQGSSSASAPLCITAFSICEQAPATVTSYLVTKPGLAAQGIETNIVTSAVDTQGFSGDGNHSTAVTIGSGTSIGSTSLCSTANCPAGTYQINGYLDVTTACSTTGGYFVSITYTDDAGSKTVVMPLIGTGVTASLLTATGISSSLALSSTSNFAQGDLFVRSTGASAITYTTTASACATGGPAVGKLFLSVVPVQ